MVKHGFAWREEEEEEEEGEKEEEDEEEAAEEIVLENANHSNFQQLPMSNQTFVSGCGRLDLRLQLQCIDQAGVCEEGGFAQGKEIEGGEGGGYMLHVRIVRGLGLFAPSPERVGVKQGVGGRKGRGTEGGVTV